MLQLANLSKAYAGRTVISVPDLTLSSGIHWFRGINGSGKTTLFRTVAGLLPFAGQVWLDQQYEVTKTPVAYRMRVNYAEAEPLYPDFLSARDLARFVGKAKQAPSGQTETLAGQLGMLDYWQQSVGTYSSGMLKKTALLLAFLGTPRVILLDEPFTTIDDVAGAVLLNLIHEARQRDVLFLLASHQDISLAGLPITATWRVQEGMVIDGHS